MKSVTLARADDHVDNLVMKSGCLKVNSRYKNPELKINVLLERPLLQENN